MLLCVFEPTPGWLTAAPAALPGSGASVFTESPALGVPALCVAFSFERAKIKYSVFAVNPSKTRLTCQPAAGAVLALFRAYSTV